MTMTDKTQNTEQENKAPIPATAPVAAEEQTKAKKPRQRVAWALIAFVVTVIGWCLLPFVVIPSMTCGVIGLICGIVGWCGHHGAWRNLAITSTVMAGTLLMVYFACWAAFAYIESAL